MLSEPAVVVVVFLQGFTVLKFDCNQPLYTQSINQTNKNKSKKIKKIKNKNKEHVRKQGKHSENVKKNTVRVLSDTHKPVKRMPYIGDKQTSQTTTNK